MSGSFNSRVTFHTLLPLVLFILTGPAWTQLVAKVDEPVPNVEDLTGGTATVVLPPPADRPVNFHKDVFPIFEAKCLSCHGPEKQKNGLRVDSRDSLIQGGDYGASIVPQDSANSFLIKVIAGADPDVRMPPSGDLLTAEEVGLVRAWIDQGANWSNEVAAASDSISASTHWGFNPVVRPPVPSVTSADWVRNPIDAFVLARLETENVTHSRPADRWTLIRRLYLDLIGLPPTPEEVEAFVSDTSPLAYDRVVTRLLASPHFGERWGRHWLDTARYADSDGYEKDLPRPNAWRYRNWVIEAFNRDLPYDQFVVEQLAGDLLPNPDTEQLVATGFHRNTLTNKEGGIDPEEDRVKQAVDRTSTLGSVFMGLTVACANCHSHKYDPLTQREFFGLYSFFNEAIEQDIPAPLAGEIQQYKKAKKSYDGQLKKIEKDISEYRSTLLARLPEWEKSVDLSDVKWESLTPASMSSSGGSSLRVLEDGSIFVEGEAPDTDRYHIVVNTNLRNISAFRLETLTHADLPKTGPGRADHGNFMLSEFRAVAQLKGIPSSSETVVFERAEADHHEKGYEIEKAIDGDPDTHWSIEAFKDLNKDRNALFVTQKPVGFENGTTLQFTLDQRYGRKHTVGRFRIVAFSGDRSQLDVPPALPGILATATSERTEDQTAMVVDYFAKSDPRMRELQSALAAHQDSEPKEPDTKAMVLAQNPKSVTTQIHIKGDFLRPGELVRPHTPAVLPALQPRSANADRLDLAYWLVRPDHPLTARVAVNRIWQYLFGHGIVETTEDFGTRGDAPSHPQLLDWLSAEYMENGWSTKNLIRLIVTSSTYRQSSNVRPDLEDLDPRNKLLARQSRFRVEAEIVRDVALATSGLLEDTIGGPSIRPPLPPGVAELGYANSVKWEESQGEDKYRRGLYIFFQRTVPYPMLMTFDCPDSNVSCARRAVSNTPLQALTMLNNPVIVECAREFGKRMVAESQDNERLRIRRAVMNSLGREPDGEEEGVLLSLLEEQKKLYAAEEESAKQLAGENFGDNVQVAEAAAWVEISRVLMNLDEFMTRE